MEEKEKNGNLIKKMCLNKQQFGSNPNVAIQCAATISILYASNMHHNEIIFIVIILKEMGKKFFLRQNMIKSCSTDK